MGMTDKASESIETPANIYRVSATSGRKTKTFLIKADNLRILLDKLFKADPDISEEGEVSLIVQKMDIMVIE